jgi:DNA (cytosine-5)-methyltransferase 1
VTLRLLDIGCCQGGATRGYQLAGFHVTGADISDQPRYIGDDFVNADGLLLLADRKFMARFDAVHTSWPCQGYTDCQRIQGREHPKLVEHGRALLKATGLPYVQENVKGAPLLDPIELCGAMFGLHTYRHRLFESNVSLTAPDHPAHEVPTVKMGRPVRDGDWYHAVGNFSNVDYIRRDLGMPWMNRDGLRESVPVAYTQHVGRQLAAQLRARHRAT